MEAKKVYSALFGLVFLLLLIGTAVLSFSKRNVSAVLPYSMNHADIKTEAFMELLCSGDLAAAEELLNGHPPLAPEQPPKDALSQALWDGYWDNLSYVFHSMTAADDYGLYRHLTIFTPDIPAVLLELQQHYDMLLAESAAAHPEAAYDSSGAYTDSFIKGTMAEEASRLLADRAYSTSHELTLRLSYSGGSWMIEYDSALMELIGGSMEAE